MTVMDLVKVLPRKTFIAVIRKSGSVGYSGSAGAFVEGNYYLDRDNAVIEAIPPTTNSTAFCIYD